MKKGTLVKYKKTNPSDKRKTYGVGIVVRVIRHLNIGHRASVHWSHGRVLNHPISFLEVVYEGR